jgi:hypothetical protein
VRQAHQAVSQMLHVKIHALKDLNLVNFTCAAGIQLFQNAFKMRRVL